MLKYSRRRFLRNTVVGATVASLGVDLNACGNKVSTTTGAPPATSEPATPALKSEGAGETATNNSSKQPSLSSPEIKGRVVKPGDAEYGEARRAYNTRFKLSPGSVLYCSNEADVIQAVKWARLNKVAIAVRGGGHSYEGFSLIDGGSIIDVSDMTDICINAAKTSATVESGITLLPLYETLWERRVVIPGGSCATVGIAGSTLGGGYGLLARSMGLTCDNLTGVRIVDSHGKVIVANADENADLLWACKGGGGGNFGIVTQFTFRLHPIGNVSIVRLRWNWQDTMQVVKAWQNWASKVDDRMTAILTISSKSADMLLGLAMFLGPPGAAKTILKPLLDAVPPKRFSVSSMPFIEAARKFSGLPSNKKGASAATNKKLLEANVKPPPEKVHLHLHTRFKGTSDYIQSDLDDKAIGVIIEALSNTSSAGSCLQLDSYGGALSRVEDDATAFCHRGATKFCLHYQVCWVNPLDDARNIKWINNFRKQMQPHVSGFAYQNYCDRDIENWEHSYYHDNLEKLIAVKQKYDPDNFFKSPQGVPDHA